MSRLTFAISLLLLLLVPATGWAQTDSEAIKLFKEGRDAIQRGDYNLACAKFEQSNALDKRVGTLLNLALCEEKRTRLVRAMETWKAAAELAERLGDERGKEATDRAAKLDPRIPRLTIVLPPDAPEGSKVRLEGLTLKTRTLEASALSQPILVDPGEVSVVLIAPDGRKSPTTVTLKEGGSQTVTLEAPTGPPVSSANGGDAAEGGVDGLMIAGIVVGVVGLAGLGVGFGFGASAKSKNDDSNDMSTPGFCNKANSCDGPGLALRDDAITAATISTVAVIIGGVAVAAGVTLIVVSLTSDDSSEATASTLELGVTPTGARARLTW